MEGFGTTLRRLRRQRGLSLRKLAERTSYDFSYLAQIERGDRPTNAHVAAACDAALHCGGALLEAYGVGKEAGDMRRRSVLQTLSTLALTAGSPIVALESLRHGLTSAIDADHDEWQLIAAEYARTFYTTAPSVLLEQLTADVSILQHLIVSERDPLAGRDLRRASGQLAVVIAMTLASTGQPNTAKRWWSTARLSADESGDLDTRIWVRAWEVVNGPYEGRPIREVITLADETIEIANGHPCAGTSGVLAGRAQALAVAGRVAEAAATVRQVEDLSGRLPPAVTEDVDSMHGWPEYRLRHTESYVYTQIGATVPAIAAQDRALELYPDTLARERAQLQLHRASCLILDGHVTDGLRYAANVLDTLPVDRHNELLNDVARRVIANVPAADRNIPLVAEIRALVTASPRDVGVTA